MTDSEGTGDTVQAAADALAAVIGEAADVDFHLTIADVTGPLRVTATSLSERLGRMYRGAVVFQTAAGLVESDLLGRDVHLRIERQTAQRSLRGMIASATVQAMHGFEGRQRVSIEIVPAMHFLAHTVDSRIYQDVGVPDLVESLVRELVGSRGRKVKKDQLTASYPAHEYIVQHQESHLDFITRLCREEGIFFYFDHDADGEDHELLVLADSNANRPVVRESSDGRVPYSANQEHARLHEVVLHAERHEQIGATDAVVSGYDWTSPGSTVKNGRTDRGRWSGPKLEVHDHFRALRQHGYDGSRYGAHTAERQAQMRAESLDLARQRWTLETTVVTAKPGHVIVLEGAGALDDRYLIVSVDGQGESDDSGIGEYRSSLEVVPESVPYRPPPPQRRLMPGPETATVVGEPGEEITTDRHGRIKVQFHWDRLGQRNERSSAWIRVVQGWAGPGWGTLFLPRIGMEVLVQFLGGDPDRPIVTGCVYNGENQPPYPLPDDKTKSTIKTNSSLGGGGYNELRFEDKAGSEEIFVHAQKDFNEVVEHDHSTHVKNDQSNTVDGHQTQRVCKDQKETVEGEQTMTVHKDRLKTVEQNEHTKILQDRTAKVLGNDELRVSGTRFSVVTSNDILTVEHGTREIRVTAGRDTENYFGGRETTVVGIDHHMVHGNHHQSVFGEQRLSVVADRTVNVVGNLYLVQGSSTGSSAAPSGILVDSVQDVLLKTATCHVWLKPTEVNVLAATTIDIRCGLSSLTLDASGTIQLRGNRIVLDAGGGTITLTPTTATMSAPASAEVLSDGVARVNGTGGTRVE